MKAKTFTKAFLLMCVLFTLFHALIWQIYTKKIFANQSSPVGDLVRMSYDVKSIGGDYDILKSDHFIRFDDYSGEQIEILTIGDSFSNGGGKGGFYQDYLAEKTGRKILNVRQLPGTTNFIESVAAMANSNFLKEKGVKHVVLETVQRHAVKLYSKEMSFELNVSVNFDKNDQKHTANRYQSKSRDIKFINTLNYNAFLYNLLYPFDDNAYSSKCYKLPLTKELFTTREDQPLLFYYRDLKSLKYEKNKKSFTRINDNFNKLAGMLKEQGIQLHFMPAVDKYALYFDYIENNPYPESQFFEILRPLERRYKLIDTKTIFQTAINNGLKDVYYASDTHWSSSALAIIVDHIDLTE